MVTGPFIYDGHLILYLLFSHICSSPDHFPPFPCCRHFIIKLVQFQDAASHNVFHTSKAAIPLVCKTILFNPSIVSPAAHRAKVPLENSLLRIQIRRLFLQLSVLRSLPSLLHHCTLLFFVEIGL